MKSVLITSSILILLLAALRPALRGRFDPRVQYALWAVAALRLLAPVELAPSAFSVMALANRAEEQTHLAQSIGRTSVPIPVQSYENAYEMAMREYQQNGWDAEDFQYDEVQAKVSSRARELQSRGPTVSHLIADCAKPIWLGGAAVMAAWFLLVNLRLRRKLRRALPVEADCPLPVYVTPELPSPCLCGIFRPAVYVTPAALTDPDRLRHVLAHELTHHRHRDHWWAWIRCLCLCLYWFDPLVWWAAAMSRQDCELACDTGAIRRLGEAERLPYGRTLVAMIAEGRNSLLQTATTMTGGKRRVKERVELIARRPKTVAALTLAAALLVVCAVGCTFTGAPEEPSTSSHDSEPITSQDPAPLPTDTLTADTLSERLGNIPENLQPQVVNRPADVSVLGESGVLASYWWNVPAEWVYELMPWMLTVYQWDQARFERHIYPEGNGGYGAFDEVVVFARDSDHYYVFDQPSPERFEMEDAEDYTAAYQAIRDFAVKTVLATEGVEPFDPKTNFEPPQEVTAVVDQLLQAPELNLHLDIQVRDNTYTSYSYVSYTTAPDADFYSGCLRNILTQFQWTEFDWGTAEDPKFPIPSQENDEQCDRLSVFLPDYTVSIQVWSNSNLVRVHDDEHGTNWYRAQYSYSDVLEPATPYDTLRTWFDTVELNSLRAPTATVPDGGRSHEDIAAEWAEAYESALTGTSPGSSFACTYMEVVNLRADLPDWLEGKDLVSFAKSHGLEGLEYGQDWFGFSYRTIFVPDTAIMPYVGNTTDYEGEGAPEGAMTYSRVGLMVRTGGGWTCQGTGSGW